VLSCSLSTHCYEGHHPCLTLALPPPYRRETKQMVLNKRELHVTILCCFVCTAGSGALASLIRNVFWRGRPLKRWADWRSGASSSSG